MLAVFVLVQASVVKYADESSCNGTHPVPPLASSVLEGIGTLVLL